MNGVRREERKAAAMWDAIKKSLGCKPRPSDVHDPSHHLGMLGCASSLIHAGAGKKKRSRQQQQQQRRRRRGDSPRSIGSSEFVHPIAHEVVLGSKCELRISTAPAAAAGAAHSPLFLRCSTTPVRRSPGLLEPDSDGMRCNLDGDSPVARQHVAGAPRSSCDAGAPCHRCSLRFANLGSLEAHHLAKHAVTELLEGDSARRIVEIICRAGWPKGDASAGGARMERVLKVHNLQKTLARFEEHREAVKARAGRLPKRHPRCLADGNELLRFYGTTVSCALGAGGSTGICTLVRCNVCSVIRHGFMARNGLRTCSGVFTTSTSRRALECVDDAAADKLGARKALIVCRVIAGRVHRPVDSLQDFGGNQFGFDSVAGRLGQFSAIEELYLLNPQALLPCFVVICKP